MSYIEEYEKFGDGLIALTTPMPLPEDAMRNIHLDMMNRLLAHIADELHEGNELMRQSLITNVEMRPDGISFIYGERNKDECVEE